jgi:hypothetical protein
VVGSGAVGCAPEGPKYEPKTVSDVKANLPPVPTLPTSPIKEGDAYTVWGASYYLRSRVHHEQVGGRDLKLTGFITKTNLAEAPKCAIHATGKEDPQDCHAPIPAFWLADKPDAPESESIKVMGWASNFAQIFDAVNTYKRLRGKPPKKPLTDNFWGMPIPNPLPGPGAKVTISGNYATTFTRASSGTEADPMMGLMTYAEMTYQQPPTEVATLPGLRP